MKKEEFDTKLARQKKEDTSASASCSSTRPSLRGATGRSPCATRGRGWAAWRRERRQSSGSRVGGRGSRLSSVLSEHPVSVKQRLSDSRRECVVCRGDQSCLSRGETERRVIEPWHQPGSGFGARVTPRGLKMSGARRGRRDGARDAPRGAPPHRPKWRRARRREPSEHVLVSPVAPTRPFLF